MSVATVIFPRSSHSEPVSKLSAPRRTKTQVPAQVADAMNLPPALGMAFAPRQEEIFPREVLDDIFGLGPLEEFLRDPAISDVLVNGAGQIYIERHGRLEKTTAAFRDDAQLIQVIQRIAMAVGQRIDTSCPMLDARLSDGSRVNAIIPPLATGGPAMSIRRCQTHGVTSAATCLD